jgi:hypothetical protein
MSVPLLVFHTSQIGLSLWVLNFSRIVVPKLQQYEDKSKKAAEYSQAAADQLLKTRATQASGVIAVSKPSISRRSYHVPTRQFRTKVYDATSISTIHNNILHLYIFSLNHSSLKTPVMLPPTVSNSLATRPQYPSPQPSPSPTTPTAVIYSRSCQESGSTSPIRASASSRT